MTDIRSILVLGATGTVGLPLTRELAGRGVRVRAATRDPSQWAGHDGVEAVRFDLRDPQTFEPALNGVETVFQLSPAGEADQLGLLAPFVETAAPRVRKIVTMTAQGVDVSDEIPLRRLELLVEKTGVEWAHLRPTWFSQNFNSYWHGPIAHQGVIPVPAGDAQTAFIDARDIATAAAAVLLDHRFTGRAWELTGPEPLTYAEAAAILSEAGGKQIRYVDVDEKAFEKSLQDAGMTAAYAGLLVMLFQAVRAGVAAKVSDDVRTLTGQGPRTLREYARDHRQAFAP